MLRYLGTIESHVSREQNTQYMCGLSKNFKLKQPGKTFEDIDYCKSFTIFKIKQFVLKLVVLWEPWATCTPRRHYGPSYDLKE